MSWKFTATETRVPAQGMVSASSGEETLSIMLTDWRAMGIWEKDFAFPGTDGCHLAVDSDAVAELGNKVGVMACFHTADGTMQHMDYLEPVLRADGQLSFARDFKREPGITGVTLKLYAKWAEGVVRFRNIRVEAAAAPAERIARVVTTMVQPTWNNETTPERMKRVESLLQKIAKEVEKPDLVLFSEAIPDLCMGLPLSKGAEPVPGPNTELFAGWARKLNCYIVFGIHEIEQGNYYNTAVILDRQGNIAGKYHKVHLTWNESESGVIPGDSFPVFQLDFGCVGIATCWDNWFGESARHLRLNGAELMLVPIAGCGIPEHRDHVWAARAGENGMAAAFAVSIPSEDKIAASRIYDPIGRILAETTQDNSYAWADINLTKRLRTRYLSVSCYGEGRSLYVRERRNGVYQRMNQA
ncbi:MAG: carbon-nitrogen hydrolase family protein [Oligosphaeraceae bacterium]|nr:carbon-nitrogen hydrolase family protein [Oligosphaeraceae bacterium]